MNFTTDERQILKTLLEWELLDNNQENWTKEELITLWKKVCKLGKVNKDVILELYMGVWHCYKDGKSMANSLFTTNSYIDACNTCHKRSYEIIQTIDFELQNNED